jgi:hypothetical protein
MSSSNDLNTIELLDDIENLLFLCDRLNNRLSQVTLYVDQVKQTWIGKRRSIELDSNVSPIIAQKAIKYNKVLLNVAEKLAVVELQTESLHNLHSTVTNIVSINDEKRQAQVPVCPSIPVTNHSSIQTLPSNVTTAKNETISTGLRLSRDAPPPVIRSLNVGKNLPSTTFTPRNTSTLFSDTVSVKTPIEQQQQQQSAFHRPLSVQDNIGVHQTKLSPQKPPIPHTPQYQSSSKIVPNGSINGLQHPISHPSDSYSCMFIK